MADLSTYPQAPFLIPPPPEKITATTTHPEPDVTTSKLAPEQKKLFDDLATLRNQQIDDALAKSEHDKEVAETKAADAKAQADELARQEAERNAAYQKTQDDITQWSTRLKEARDKYDNAPTPQLFHDGDTYGNVMKALAVGLSGAADAMRARISVMTGRDQGPSAVDAIINGDLDRQREKIKMMKDKAVMAEAGLNDAQEARKLLLAEVDARGAMAFKRVVAIGKANLEAQGKGQADIEANDLIAKARKEELEAQGRAVNDMTQKIVKQGKDITITENENKESKNPNTTPTHINDILTGEALPVDPTATDSRQHNAATADLAPINTFLDTSTKLIRAAEAEGPARSSLLTRVFGGDQTQSGREATVVRLRSAYAKAKGESIGEGNRKELEQAIPSPPSAQAPQGMWDAWRTKIDSVQEEMVQLRKEKLANAGVPLEVIARASDQGRWGRGGGQHGAVPSPSTAPVGQSTPPAPSSAAKDSPEDVNSQAPLPEDPNAQSIDDFQPKAPPKRQGVAGLKAVPTPTPAQSAAPVANPVDDLRARTIRKLKANPNLPGAKVVMKQLGITDEDLR